MPRAFLLAVLLLLASSVRADDVSEAALAGRWKVVGTAPTAKNRDGLAELEKHGCYLYFEFAANGRAAIGIGSDSKAKLEALKKANSDVELEWSAKYEVVNGRVEVSGFPARLREPGGWLGDSGTAVFKARLDGDALELTGPGGFVAFQKVKQAGAPAAKATPKADANPLAGRWRIVKMLNSTTDPTKMYATKGFHYYFEFGPNGALTAGVDATDKQFLTTYVQGVGAGKVKTSAKYKLGPNGALEISDIDPDVRARYGLVAGTFTHTIDGDELTLSDGGTRPMKLVRVSSATGALVGVWRVTANTSVPKDVLKTFDEVGAKLLLAFAAEGTVKLDLRNRDGTVIPTGQGAGSVWKYRALSDTEVEFFDVPQHLLTGGPTGGKERATLKYKLTGDTLVITEADGKNTMTLQREKK
jgi:hypothetical protein